MAACYTLGRHHYFWRRPHGAGALIKVELASGVEARLLLDVDEVEAAGGADDEGPAPPRRTYALRFEAFAARACEADVERLLAKAQRLTDGLLRDFPGLVASAVALGGVAQPTTSPGWRPVEARPASKSAWGTA